MQELRCLFALMVGSTRRFVDPSAAVELLRDAFRTSEAQQVRTRKTSLSEEPRRFWPVQSLSVQLNQASMLALRS